MNQRLSGHPLFQNQSVEWLYWCALGPVIRCQHTSNVFDTNAWTLLIGLRKLGDTTEVFAGAGEGTEIQIRGSLMWCLGWGTKFSSPSQHDLCWFIPISKLSSPAPLLQESTVPLKAQEASHLLSCFFILLHQTQQCNLPQLTQVGTDKIYLNQEMAPQTPEFPPFLLWEIAYTFALLLPFTKVYKEPESFLTSFFFHLFQTDCGSSVSQSLACNLFRGSSVGDISPWHTLSLICCFQFHLLFQYISLSLTKTGCDDFLTVWQKKGLFWSWNVGFLSEEEESGVFVRNEFVSVCVCIALCVYGKFGNLGCILWMTGGGWGREHGGFKNGLMASLMDWLSQMI